MSTLISGYASYTRPKLAFRDVTGNFKPSEPDKNKLESLSFHKAVDLISEGPIEGFCDATGKLISGNAITKGIYFDNVPIQITLQDPGSPSAYNFSHTEVAFMLGTSGQSGLYTGQGWGAGATEREKNLYWLEDFSYTSRTIAKSTPLYAVRTLQGKSSTLFRASHAVQDQDVDWLGLTVNVNNCSYITDDNIPTGFSGRLEIWGDFTGYMHRSFYGDKIQPVPLDGGERKVYLDFKGLATSPYHEDLFLKLYDSSDLKRTKNIYIRNVSKERESVRTRFDVSLATVTEITKINLSYPNTAYVSTLMNAEEFGRVPTRTFDLKLKRVRVPSNYVFEENKELDPNTDPISRHVGTWDGTFKKELEWTDNPAWIFYDLVTNERYGLGEYIDRKNVDKWQLYEIAKYCDGAVPTSKLKPGFDEASTSPERFIKERRYSCNILFTTRTEAYKAMNEMASVFQGMVFYNSNIIFVTQDRKQNAIHHFTNSSVVGGAFEYSGSAKNARFTVCKVAYKDKDDNFLPKYEYIEDPEGIIRHGIISKEVVALGCTSRDQALRLGRWTLLTSNREQDAVTFQTDRQAEYLKPGNIIEISDETRHGTKSGGRIKSIVNNKGGADANKNYILLDQQLPTGNYEFSKISFVIPTQDQQSSDGSQKLYTQQTKTFVSRNNKHREEADDGTRGDIIPLTGTESYKVNYIENTTSGAKIKTSVFDDLLLESPNDQDWIDVDDPAYGYKTFNHYLIDNDTIPTIPTFPFVSYEKVSSNPDKIAPGSIYILEASGKSESYTNIEKREYRVLGVTESDGGVYSIAALQYDTGKFADVDYLSPVYNTASVAITPTIPEISVADQAEGNIVSQTFDISHKFQQGYPLENSVGLIVEPEAILIEGELGGAVSKVNYYLYDTSKTEDVTDGHISTKGYNIRVQEITDSYYGGLSDHLKDPEYVISGQQECSAFELIHNADQVHQFGGSVGRAHTLTNFNEASFNTLNEFKRVKPNSLDFKELQGCEDSPNYDPASNSMNGELLDELTCTGKKDVISGSFALSDPNKYYEVRWSEYNNVGSSPEKSLIFRAARDEVAPKPLENFTASMSLAIPNVISFNWENPEDQYSDLAGVRIYTGHNEAKGADVTPTKNSHLLATDGNFATYLVGTKGGAFKGVNAAGAAIDFGSQAKFHISPFDWANNTGDAVNSNVLSLLEYQSAPSLILSGQILEEGIGTDNYTQQPKLHIFYSGTLHDLEPDRFDHYFVAISEPNNAQMFTPYYIRKEDIETANEVQFPQSPVGSGHLAVNAVANSTYTVRVKSAAVDNTESPLIEKSLTIGKDVIAPAAVKEFNIYKTETRLLLRWNPPPEPDFKKIVLYTGSGHTNFGLGESEVVDRIETHIDSEGKARVSEFDLEAEGDYGGAFNFSSNYFINKGNKTIKELPFHIVPVDTSNNTGMYTNATLELTAPFDPPYVRASGELTDDDRSLVHVFYSGIAQNSSSFRYYSTNYQEHGSLVVNTIQDSEKALRDDSVEWLGSGHFAFEAKGNTRYDIKTKVVGDLIESDFAEALVISEDTEGGDIISPPDEGAPGDITNFSVSALSNNSETLEFNWDPPSDEDLKSIVVFTGRATDQGHFETQTPPYLNEHNTAAFVFSTDPQDYPQFRNVYDFVEDEVDLQSALTLNFHAVAVDTSNNTGAATAMESIDIVDDGTFYAAPIARTSGSIEQKPDGTEDSLVHLFYTGQGQDSSLFKHYHIEYSDPGSLHLKHVYDETIAAHTMGVYGMGSGHYSFEAQGNKSYNFSIETVDTNGNKSPKTFASFTALKDTVAPGVPTWIKYPRRYGDHIFLSWDNPADIDFKETIVITGRYSDRSESGIYLKTKHGSEAVEVSDFYTDTNSIYFWLQSVDTSNNTGEMTTANRGVNVNTPLYGDSIGDGEFYAKAGIDNDLLGDGAANPFINFMIKEDIQDSVPIAVEDTYVGVWPSAVSIDDTITESKAVAMYGAYRSQNPGFSDSGPPNHYGDAGGVAFWAGVGAVGGQIKLMIPAFNNEANGVTFELLESDVQKYRQIQSYNFQISRNDSFNPIIDSATIPAAFDSPDTELFISGSGNFNNLLADEQYYLRAKRGYIDGRYDSSYKTYSAPITTLKDQTIPSELQVSNFTITPGPKQVFLEWDFSDADLDLASILVYKTGIPTGRIGHLPYAPSSPSNVWDGKDISGYFESNPNEFSYKLNPGTAFIDNDIETGIYNEVSEIYDPIYYHYLLKLEDRSKNVSVGFVSGVSTSIHTDPPGDAYRALPHNMGYVTGGGIDDSYIENIRAGKILTDRITSNTFILANPSGRIVSDEVYALGGNDPRYMYSEGDGLYIDHKMFRIGDPTAGGEGLFFTGQKDADGDFIEPTFDSQGNIELNPNTLEIRGNMTAGTIGIGASEATQLRVESDGTISIGNQSTDVTGWFKNTVMGDEQGSSEPVVVQLDLDDLDSDQKLVVESQQNAFLQLNWVRGEQRGVEIRGINTLEVVDSALDYGVAKLNSPRLELSLRGDNGVDSNGYGIAGVTASGDALSKQYLPTDPNNRRDSWRLIDVKFKVTNDGRLFARDATIAGTVTAAAFKANETLTLGEKGSERFSIIQSLGFRADDDDCNTIPSGWRIRGDGTAYFQNIEVVSGLISGATIRIGKCLANSPTNGSNVNDKYFNVDNEGNMFIGDQTTYSSNPFYVTNEGVMNAQGAVLGSATIQGDTTIQGTATIDEMVIVGDVTARHIRIKPNYIGTFDANETTEYTSIIRNNGIADFTQINVSGGMITGATLAIGDNGGYPRFYARSNGSLSIGGSLTLEDNDFYVTSDGDLTAAGATFTNVNVANIINAGTMAATAGTIGGIDIYGSSLESEHWVDFDSTWANGWSAGPPVGFKITTAGAAYFNDLYVTGGTIRGASLALGKVADKYLQVDSLGNLSVGGIGVGASYGGANFYVDNEGKLYAGNAEIEGSIIATDGAIGGFNIGGTYIATDGNSDASTAHRHAVAGIYFDNDGNFSIANQTLGAATPSAVFSHDAGNDYISVTGLKSPGYTDVEDINGRAVGFYLKGGTDRETSYISNFQTDNFSSSGIAQQVDTQLCGSIAFPTASTDYKIIKNNRVQYTLLGNDSVDVEWIGASPTPSYTLKNSDALTITDGSPIAVGKDLILTTPADVFGATALNFNIGLTRS